VPVEPRLYALLEEAVQISGQTDGAFDITAGPLARLWGFVERSGAMPEQQAIERALEQVGSRHVELDSAAGTVRFSRPGVELNLGGIGKGYALDRCLELLSAAGVHDVLLHGGQSSVLASGACVEPGHPDGWTIGLRNPYRPEQRIAHLHLRDRALATSGSGTQFFEHAGRRYGHILDPRSGWPASGVLSATVVAPRAAQADALSTAFYVLGPARAAAFCAERPEIGFVLLCPGAGHAAVEIHTAGLADGQFTTL
jgi:thiamine biosynthesis lipoprotein